MGPQGFINTLNTAFGGEQKWWEEKKKKEQQKQQEEYEYSSPKRDTGNAYGKAHDPGDAYVATTQNVKQAQQPQQPQQPQQQSAGFQNTGVAQSPKATTSNITIDDVIHNNKGVYTAAQQNMAAYITYYAHNEFNALTKAEQDKVLGCTNPNDAVDMTKHFYNTYHKQ